MDATRIRVDREPLVPTVETAHEPTVPTETRTAGRTRVPRPGHRAFYFPSAFDAANRPQQAVLVGVALWALEYNWSSARHHSTSTGCGNGGLCGAIRFSWSIAISLRLWRW